MKDKAKTKAQLLDELAAMRQNLVQMHQRITELEASETQIPQLGRASNSGNDYWRSLIYIAPEMRNGNGNRHHGRSTPHSETQPQLVPHHRETETIDDPKPESAPPLEQKAIADPPERFQFPEHPQLLKIFAFIEANYHRSIGLTEVAQEFDYSASYLTNLVRRLTGQTLYQWIVQRRMFQARYLLLSTDLSVSQISEAVGYLDTGHFIKHFRQLHEKPPKTWRDCHRHQ